MVVWLIGVVIAVLLWGLLWKNSPRAAFGAVVGFLLALALYWLFAPQLTMFVTGMNEIPVWLPPLPIVLVVIVLFYFGIRTWLNADNLPPPRETHDEHHGHGHH
jgi:hypothetical protein